MPPATIAAPSGLTVILIGLGGRIGPSVESSMISITWPLSGTVFEG